MPSKIWMLTPAIALATASLVAFIPGDEETARSDVSTCVKLASADSTDVMSDATPDACVYAVQADAKPDCARSVRVLEAHRVVTMTDTRAVVHPVLRVRLQREGHDVEAADRDSAERDTVLEWPGDFIALTADAAATVWNMTIGFIGDAYDFAERKARGLWI